jgi:alkylation response protein AidB-like acyl-CoA dehydrogenase
LSAITDRLEAGDASLWPTGRIDRALASTIEGLREILEAAESEGERIRHLPRDAVDALASAGLFKVSLPVELGGWEADVLLELEVFEAVSRISTSACWNVIVANFHSSLPAVFCSDEAVKEIFLGSSFPVVAGQPASIGRGRLVDGGIVVSGRYGWGSGITHADWVIGGVTMESDGDRPPERRAWVAPKSSVNVLDNWYVAGLMGTGSSDYVVEELFVPDGWWFPFGDPGPLTGDTALVAPSPLRGGPKYRAVVRVWAMSGHIAVLLGGAERALEQIAELASRKRRRNASSSVADREVFRHELGSSFVLLSATRDHALRLFAEVAELTAAGEPVTRELVQQIYGLSAHTARTAVAVAQMAYSFAGGDSVRLDNPLQRILRDLLVAHQHLLYTDAQFEQLGEMLVRRASKASERDRDG